VPHVARLLSGWLGSRDTVASFWPAKTLPAKKYSRPRKGTNTSPALRPLRGSRTTTAPFSDEGNESHATFCRSISIAKINICPRR